MSGQYPPPPPPENMGRQAASSALSGFSGCLGVGLAIIFAALLFLGGCALLVAHSGHSSGSSVPSSPARPGAAAVVPATPVRSAIASVIGPGPSVPPENATARDACEAVSGNFARDYSWTSRSQADYSLYECDRVPYLADDGSIYVIDLRYNSSLRLVAPTGVVGSITRQECESATYPEADSSPGPGIWNPRLGLCMPTASQIHDDW
jgi:hypothetical protein